MYKCKKSNKQKYTLKPSKTQAVFYARTFSSKLTSRNGVPVSVPSAAKPAWCEKEPMRALCGCIQSNLQHIILFSLCDWLLTWLIWSSFTFNIAFTSSFLRSITCPCLSDISMHCRHWIQEHFLNMESHLWLKVNWLQTTTFKLHHCFEAFAVLSLPSTKHQQRQREKETLLLKGENTQK